MELHQSPQEHQRSAYAHAFAQTSQRSRHIARCGLTLIRPRHERTEHALLDDNGDGLGTPAEWFRGIRPVQKARDDAALDGYRAHQIHLLYSESETAMPPDLRAKRDQLELQVMELRDTRATLSDEDYFARLEPLLREVAQIYEQADKQPSK